MSVTEWKRICDAASLSSLREAIVHDDVDHLLTITHHGDGPTLFGAYSGFGSSKITHIWLRHVNTSKISEVVFIGVQWYVSPESLPLDGWFDSLDRVNLHDGINTNTIAARCSMLGHRYVDSLPQLALNNESVA
ncbi:MAG TPA: hypothetical protein PKD64_15705 [Pirellulaceae bacterium]|nr:hypothetical protein [Pirellulaceae bacterium]HMO93632.1 hypothetical protein [Pirellulaceae bacterium]HMP70504.1 hypothetical protein [Pirellulaceae bacterium]